MTEMGSDARTFYLPSPETNYFQISQPKNINMPRGKIVILVLGMKFYLKENFPTRRGRNKFYKIIYISQHQYFNQNAI